jgi:uncharacterized protein YdeI (YjbR/CyaY-like superfamily)
MNSESTLTYAAALDAALCWGWIDSQKRALDDTAWLQRFTPRTAKSLWSKINRSKAEALIASGQLEAPGLAEVEKAKQDGRWARAYDGAKKSTVPRDLADAFERDDRARAVFEAHDSANRYAILYRVATAKSTETRAQRIAKFVAMCAANKTLHPVRAKAAGATRPSRKPTAMGAGSDSARSDVDYFWLVAHSWIRSRLSSGERSSTRVMSDRRTPNGSRIEANRSPETNVAGFSRREAPATTRWRTPEGTRARSVNLRHKWAQRESHWRLRRPPDGPLQAFMSLTSSRIRLSRFTSSSARWHASGLVPSRFCTQRMMPAGALSGSRFSILAWIAGERF